MSTTEGGADVIDTRPVGYGGRRAWAVLGFLLLVLVGLAVLVWLSVLVRPTVVVPERWRFFDVGWSYDSQDLGALLQVICIVIGLIGIAMVFIPGLVLRPFGIRLDPSGTFAARLYGATGMALADALWDGQGSPDALQGLGNAVFYYSFFQALVIVLAVVRKVANPLALGVVFLDAAFIATIWLHGWARS